MGTIARILVVLAFVGGGGVYAFALRQPAEPEPEPTVEVRVAAVDLAIGDFLDDEDAPFAAVPLSDRPEGAVAAGETDVVGAVVIRPIKAGEPAPRDALLTPGQEGFLAAALKPGRRAVSVAVDPVSGNAGHIFPGDRVDLILTQRVEAREGDDPMRAWASETILRDVRVIAVDQRLNADLASRESAETARTITLEVTATEAQAVAVARNLGALSMTLRSLVVETVEAADAEAPTWAGDVSAVRRMAMGEPEPEPAAATAEAPPRRAITLIQGPSRSEVTP